MPEERKSTSQEIVRLEERGRRVSGKIYKREKILFYMVNKKVNWTSTLIISIFLGSLGVDRFIMGHIGLGILKLITLGGCGVWALIDIILIATKHQFKGVEWVEN
ncbi:MAG: TM2 domain-containing protein [Nanoarchaeota archaeon]|nr:TM2 domain-containing protein [Nanoarchaeota archaeon]